MSKKGNKIQLTGSQTIMVGRNHLRPQVSDLRKFFQKYNGFIDQEFVEINRLTDCEGFCDYVKAIIYDDERIFYYIDLFHDPTWLQPVVVREDRKMNLFDTYKLLYTLYKSEPEVGKTLIIQNFIDDLQSIIDTSADQYGDEYQRISFYIRSLSGTTPGFQIIIDGINVMQQMNSRLSYGLRFNFNVTGTDAGKATRLGILSKYNDQNGHAHTWNEVDVLSQTTLNLKQDLFIHKQMRRCVVNTDISDPMNPQYSVNYYLHPDNSDFKEDGITPAVLDGSDGQVMVQIPRFYQKVVWQQGSDQMQWWISPTRLEGYEVHPAFKKIINDKEQEVPYRYMGAYQGVIGIDGIFLDCYDYTGTHIRDVTEYRSIYLMSASNPKLGSVSGFLPTCYGTRAEFRAACRRIDGNNDDSTWRQKDWQLTSAIQLLFLIEYATPNSQYCLTKTLTGGLTNIALGTLRASVKNAPYNYNPIVPTGGTNRLGNKSGSVPLEDIYSPNGLPTFNGTSETYWTDVVPSYRGIQMPYGHIWQWTDGININKSSDLTQVSTYLASGKFADNTNNEPYAAWLLNAPHPTANGYFTRIHEDGAENGFYPRAHESGGGTNTGFTDYHYPISSGWRVAAVGGRVYDGGQAGLFDLHSYYSSGSRFSLVGGRLSL